MGKLEKQIMIGALALVGILVAVVILKGLSPREDGTLASDPGLGAGPARMLDGAAPVEPAPRRRAVPGAAPDPPCPLQRFRARCTLLPTPPPPR